MVKEQDFEIISSLTTSDGETTYSISKDIGASVPQVQYRIDKLLKCGIVKSKRDDSKTLYYIHPALKSKKAMSEVATYIKAIVDVIDNIERLSPEGMKALVSFIVSKTELSEVSDDYTDTERNTIQSFRKYIDAYAKEKGLKILDVKGWTSSKIEWMALNDRKCACRPDKRVCPCPEGLVEIEKKGKCLCTVFGV